MVENTIIFFAYISCSYTSIIMGRKIFRQLPGAARSRKEPHVFVPLEPKLGPLEKNTRSRSQSHLEKKLVGSRSR